MVYINGLSTTGDYMVWREFATTLAYYAEFEAGTEEHNDTTFIVQFQEWDWSRNVAPTGQGTCYTTYCYTMFQDPAVHLANRVEAYFHLTVQPPVQVYITGPDSIKLAGQYQWIAHPSGGSGSYTYHWERRDDEGSWYSAGTASTYVAVVDTGTLVINLRVVASSVGKSDTSTFQTPVDARESLLTLPPIGGPTSIESEGEYEWTAEPTGGTGQYSYAWYYKVHMWYPKPYPTALCEGDWLLVGTGDSYSQYVYEDEYDFYIKVVVSSGTQEREDSKKVYPFEEEDPICPERR